MDLELSRKKQILLVESDMKFAENIHRAQTPLQIVVVDSHMILGTIKVRDKTH